MPWQHYVASSKNNKLRMSEIKVSFVMYAQRHAAYIQYYPVFHHWHLMSFWAGSCLLKCPETAMYLWLIRVIEKQKALYARMWCCGNQSNFPVCICNSQLSESLLLWGLERSCHHRAKRKQDWKVKSIWNRSALRETFCQLQNYKKYRRAGEHSRVEEEPKDA